MRILKSFIVMIFVLLLFPLQNISGQFAKGADIGWLSEMEDNGYKFKDNSGIKRNCLEILKDKGINSLRFRVWVNPTDGYCGKKDVTYMAGRADSMGFDIMLDFHYSDSWADPAKQNKPAAWENHSLDELLEDIYKHTYEVLDTLKSVGITPKWVQIGNEVNDGMLWETGRASKNMSNFAKMINSGYNAVKDIDTSIQVIVHLSDGHNRNMYRWMFDGLKKYGAQWDIVGMSVYPYWAGLSWETDVKESLATMKYIIDRYNTKVMVCETGYLYYKPLQAYNFLVDLIAKTKSVNGLGVFYWEPECYDNGYELGAWNPLTKQPTKAMDAFLDSTATDVKQSQIPDYFHFNIYPNPFNPNTTIEYSLSKYSIVSIKIYNTLGEEVANLLNEYQTAGSYNINWSANNVPSGVYFCRIKGNDFSETKILVLLK